MTRQQKLDFLLNTLSEELPNGVPEHLIQLDERDRLRALMNIRPPKPISGRFLKIQDALLQEELQEKTVTDATALPSVPLHPMISLWRGDITTLQADVIVNAANSGMLGCFVPCHGCIDNAIHSAAGIQLREECHRLMEAQGYPEPTGQAKITEAYNLPSRHVIHTVGPIIGGGLSKTDCDLLASCYRSCMELAQQNNVMSSAFCCISTGGCATSTQLTMEPGTALPGVLWTPNTGASPKDAKESFLSWILEEYPDPKYSLSLHKTWCKVNYTK